MGKQLERDKKMVADAYRQGHAAGVAEELKRLREWIDNRREMRVAKVCYEEAAELLVVRDEIDQRIAAAIRAGEVH